MPESRSTSPLAEQPLESSADGKATPWRRLAEIPIWYYGWVNVLSAAVMINATLPARTHGLGLITKPLLADLSLGEVTYGWFNFFSVLIGALFCVPLGRCIDYFGSRLVLTTIVLVFGLVTIWTSAIVEPYSLFVALLLSRGLAQGGITVGAGALVGKWFRRHVGIAMAVYSILMRLGFVACTGAAWLAVRQFGWRTAWLGLGLIIVFAVSPATAWLTRSLPSKGEPEMDLPPEVNTAARPAANFTPRESLSTPGFWVFTLGYAMYTLAWSAVTLFNESILLERGFSSGTFVMMMSVVPIGGGLAQPLVGWLSNNWRLGGVMALGLLFLACAMGSFPFLTRAWQVAGYAVVLGFAGSFIMVSHLAFYPRAFGGAHLGQINGAAQVAAFIVSASGPVIMAACKQFAGSYASMFFCAAAVMLGLAVSAWITSFPRREST